MDNDAHTVEAPNRVVVPASFFEHSKPMAIGPSCFTGRRNLDGGGSGCMDIEAQDIDSGVSAFYTAAVIILSFTISAPGMISSHGWFAR